MTLTSTTKIFAEVWGKTDTYETKSQNYNYFSNAAYIGDYIPFWLRESFAELIGVKYTSWQSLTYCDAYLQSYGSVPAIYRVNVEWGNQQRSDLQE